MSQMRLRLGDGRGAISVVHFQRGKRRKQMTGTELRDHIYFCPECRKLGPYKHCRACQKLLAEYGESLKLKQAEFLAKRQEAEKDKARLEEINGIFGESEWLK